jgi:hypothetical protein
MKKKFLFIAAVVGIIAFNSNFLLSNSGSLSRFNLELISIAMAQSESDDCDCTYIVDKACLYQDPTTGKDKIMTDWDECSN